MFRVLLVVVLIIEMQLSCSTLGWLGIVLIALSSYVPGTEAKNLTCYVCNVYTGGAGAMCYEDKAQWWHRGSCDYCMKVYTEQRNLYHRNHPIVTTTISRICAQKTEALYKYDTCERHIGAATFSIRCWCHTNDCNSAASLYLNTTTTMFSVATLLASLFLMTKRL